MTSTTATLKMTTCIPFGNAAEPQTDDGFSVHPFLDYYELERQCAYFNGQKYQARDRDIFNATFDSDGNRRIIIQIHPHLR